MCGVGVKSDIVRWMARRQIVIPIRSFCSCRLIPGSVSRARYERPKGNFLLGVITRSCVHTSSATFPQLLAQLARTSFTVNCCTRVLTTNRRNWTRQLPIDQLAIASQLCPSVFENVVNRERIIFRWFAAISNLDFLGWRRA